MTLVTVDAVVNVSRHVVVLEVIRVIVPMAASALEHGVVIRVNVAGGTDVVRIAVIGRERRVLRVVKGGAGPGRGVVAVLARSREKLRLRRVSRIRRVVVVRLVAPYASGWQCRVVIVDVAIRALARRDRVRSGQRECRFAVIKGRIGPDDCVVTELARSREAGRGVGRIVRAGVILLVARVAQRAIQAVVVVDVAIGAQTRRHEVRIRQGEAGG